MVDAPPAPACADAVEAPRAAPLKDRRHVALLLGVLLLAAALRFPLLTTIPVGLHYDEAWSGLDAASVTWAHHPIFFTDSNGMEPLYLYLQTVSMLLFGRTAFALRVVSAVIGLATVYGLYLLGRAMAGRWLGLFAAAVLAVTYWHVHVSRLGYRAVALPLVECFAWWALWRGVQRRDWRWLALGGGLVGLSLYTYSTARAFPFAVALWFCWLAIARRQWRPILELGGAAVAALLVFAPLGWYFLQHPTEFIERVGQVVVLSPEVTHAGPPPVVTGIIRTLGMFSFHGDPQWKYNLSGKPVFDPFMSIAFYGGIAACLVLAVRGLRRRAEATPPEATAFALPTGAAALLLCWFAVMIVPGFITTDPPETLHTLATVPAVCTFPAAGFLLGWRALRAWRPKLPRVGLPLAAALIGAEAVATAISYFLIWAPNPQTYYWLHGDVADMARRLEAAPANDAIYIATEYFKHPTVLFLAPKATPRMIWFDATRALPVRPAARPALYAFAHGYGPLPDAASALPASALLAAPKDRTGATEYEIYALPSGATLPPLATSLRATLGNEVTLLGATITPPSAQAPTVARVSLRWRVDQLPPAPLSLFVHVLDTSGHRWAQEDGQGFFSNDWHVGDEVVTTEQVTLPPGTPPTSLILSADFYDVASGRPLPITAAGGAKTAPDSGLVVGSVTPLPSAYAPELRIPGARPAQTLSPGVALVGAVLPTTPVRAGDAIDVTLYLRKTAAGLVRDPALRVEGLPAAEREPIPSAALLDRLPRGGLLAVRHLVTVSPRATADRATVQVAAGDGWLTLGSVPVTPLARSAAAPSPRLALAVHFGDVAELLGYDLRADADGHALHLTLYWKALAVTDTSYTVFTHAVGADGKLIGQHDGLPAAGAWPTTFWLPGQIVADEHTITLPGGSALAGATIQVGLYDAQTSIRLPASGAAGTAGDTYALLRP